MAKKAEKGTKLATCKTILSIYRVLQKYASKTNPLSVTQIEKYLNEDTELKLAGFGEVSSERIERILQDLQENALADNVFPWRLQSNDDSPAEEAQLVTGFYKPKSGEIRLIMSQGGVLNARVEEGVDRRTVKNQLNAMRQAIDENDEALFHIGCLVKDPEGSGQYTDADDLPDSEHDTRKCLYYLDNRLDSRQWDMFYNMTAQNPYIDEETTKQFLDALSYMDPALKEKHKLRSSKQPYEFKAENPNSTGKKSLQELLGVLDDAIQQHYFVNLDYGEYRLEKNPKGKWVPKLRSLNNRLRKVYPFSLYWANGLYYLLTWNHDEDFEGVKSYRVDRILKAVPVVSEKKKVGTQTCVIYEKPGPDFQAEANAVIEAKHRERSPMMFGGREKDELIVTLQTDGKASGWLNAIVDTFGLKNVYYKPLHEKDDGSKPIEFRVVANKTGLKMFILQHLDIIRMPKQTNEPAEQFRMELKKLAENSIRNLGN